MQAFNDKTSWLWNLNSVYFPSSLAEMEPEPEVCTLRPPLLLSPHACNCASYGPWHNTPARKGLNIRAACAGDLFMLIESQERLPEEWVRSPC